MASPPHTLFLELFNRLNTQPRLEDIPLPAGMTAGSMPSASLTMMTGRSLNACRLALDEMRRGSMYSPLSSTGVVSTPLSAPIPQLKRHAGVEASYSAGRAILPKTSNYPYATSVNEPPAKRKRGRPTKAEQQARAAELAGTTAGESSALQARFNTPLSASVPASPVVETRPSSTLAPISRIPISTMISTPVAPKSASHSGSSSGKKKRRRKSDEQAPHNEPGPSAPPPYRPYSRPANPDDAHAGARYRDELIHSSVAQLVVSEPEQSSGAQRMSTGSPRPRGPHLPLPYQPGRQ